MDAGRCIPKKLRAERGACLQCGVIPLGGLPRKIVDNVDVGQKKWCVPCLEKLSERRKVQRAVEVRPAGLCNNCTRQIENPLRKYCNTCLETKKRSNQRPAVKRAKKEYSDSAIGKEKILVAGRAPHRKAKKKEWANSEVGKEKMRVASNNYYHEVIKVDPVRVLDMKLCTLVRFGLKDGRDSKTVREHTGFSSAQDVHDHLQSLLEPGMTMHNHGKGEDKWHIGHRIARALYDFSIKEDVRRAWSKSNIFPQWERENLSEGVNLPDDASLLELRTIWPSAWNDKLPNKEDRIVLERRARLGIKE